MTLPCAPRLRFGAATLLPLLVAAACATPQAAEQPPAVSTPLQAASTQAQAPAATPQEPAFVTLRLGPAARWFAATPFVRDGLGSRWPATNVVEGICIPHPTRTDACWALGPEGSQLVTWAPVEGPPPTPQDAPPQSPQPALVRHDPYLDEAATDDLLRQPRTVCTISESGTDILRLCDSYSRNGPPSGFRVERLGEDGSAIPERAFSWTNEDAWPFRASLPAGVLAFHGSCAGQRSDARVCVRNRGGDYEELQVPRPLPSNAMVDTPLSADGKMEVVAWIPGDDKAFTIVLARARRTVVFTREDALRIDKELSAKLHVKLSERYRSCELASLQGGVLRYLCRWQRAAAAVELDLADKSVRVEPAPFAEGESPFGLRVTETGSVLESVDGWKTWRPVEGPPQKPAPEPSLRCHRMGCRLGDWVRLGWGP